MNFCAGAVVYTNEEASSVDSAAHPSFVQTFPPDVFLMEGVGCLTTSLFSEVVRFFFALALGRAGSEGRTTKPRVCRWPRPAWKALASTPAGLVALETRLWHVRSSRNSRYGTDGAAPPKPDLDCSIFCASRWQPAAGFLALEDFESFLRNF